MKLTWRKSLYITTTDCIFLKASLTHSLALTHRLSEPFFVQFDLQLLLLLYVNACVHVFMVVVEVEEVVMCLCRGGIQSPLLLCIIVIMIAIVKFEVLILYHHRHHLSPLSEVRIFV